MKKILILFVILSGIIFQGCSALFTSEPKYIRVRETQFELDGKPYYFAGVNFWYGAYLGSPGSTGDRDRLIRELDFLKELGIINLRVCAASEESLMGRSIRPAFQKSPGVYDENLFIGLDFLMSELRKRDMHAVLYLNNYWQWTGGMAQYHAWFRNESVPDPDDPKIGYGKFMDYSAEFYRNEEAITQFQKYLFYIINRKNTVTGEYYYEDPAIMAWQLANEPRPGRDPNISPIEPFLRWIDETAKYIHTLDPNHLVTTGSEGLVGSYQVEEIFLKSHEFKSIDYACMHLWPKNWSWFDARKAEETYPATEKNAIEYINKHLIWMKQLNKPITLEEFGLPRDMEEYKVGSSTIYRDKYFSKLFTLIKDSIEVGAPIAGTNVWGWGGEGRAKTEDAIWREGDPLTGDPAQEPQGLNSIFNNDLSTLEIFRKHAKEMNEMRNGKFRNEVNNISAK